MLVEEVILRLARTCEEVAMGLRIGQIARKHSLDEAALVQAVRAREPRCKDKNFIPSSVLIQEILRDMGVVVEALPMGDESAAPSEPQALEFGEDELALTVTRPPQAAYAVHCHDDVVSMLGGKVLHGALGRRLTLILTHLAAYGRTSVVKGTRGNDNRGWRRTPLGGNGGNQFYVWWAPRDAPPVSDLLAPDRAVFVRAVRHHDEHATLGSGFLDTYHPLAPVDLATSQDFPEPWTEHQIDFVRSAAPVRVLRGYPGSGKTTALWRAIEARDEERVLYLTWSNRLRELAAAYFLSFKPLSTLIEALTFSSLFAAFTGREVAHAEERAGRAQFLEAVRRLAPNQLGPWTKLPESLYAEVRAHLVGAHLPDYPASERTGPPPRLGDEEYLRIRASALGSVAAQAVLTVVRALERAGPLGAYFPDLTNAWEAGACLLRGDALPGIAEAADRVVIDEAQDLTPLETWVAVRLARCIGEKRPKAPFFLLAGDEGQTVRPTDFEWGWCKRLLTQGLRKPDEVHLSTNVRCPRRIASLVNELRRFYHEFLPKEEQPADLRRVQIEESTSDVIIACATTRGPELTDLLLTLRDRPQLPLVRLGEQMPDYIPEEIRESVFIASDIKGLDFEGVCILDVGLHLESLASREDYSRRGPELSWLWKRTALDNLRVAISRPAETLIFLDVDPTPDATRRLQELLQGLRPTPMDAAELRQRLDNLEADPTELVQQCVTDALSLYETRPVVALRRARQAVSLLGDRPDLPQAVSDPTLRREAHLTLARVCLSLLSAHQTVKLSLEDLLRTAREAAREAEKDDLQTLLNLVLEYQFTPVSRGYGALRTILFTLEENKTLEPWVTAGLQTFFAAWQRGIRDCVIIPKLGGMVSNELPRLYQGLGCTPEEAEKKTHETRRMAVETFLSAGLPEDALQIARTLRPPVERLLAQCLEALKRYEDAARAYEALGDAAAAYRNYRACGQIDESIRLAEATALPNRDIVRWLGELHTLMGRMPPQAADRMTPAERALALGWLEAGGLIDPTAEGEPRSGRARKGRPKKPPAPTDENGDGVT